MTRPGLSIREIIGRTKEGVSTRTGGVQTLTQYDELQGDFVLFPQNEKKLRDNSSSSAFINRPLSASSRDLNEEKDPLKESGVVNSHGIQIRMVRIKGDIRNEQVVLTFLMTNEKANTEVMYGDVYAIDDDGDEYQNNVDTSHITLYTDVPRSITITLKQIPPGLQRFNHLRFRLKASQGGEWQTIEFRRVPMDWK